MPCILAYQISDGVPRNHVKDTRPRVIWLNYADGKLPSWHLELPANRLFVRQKTTDYWKSALHIDRYDCITITYLFWMNAKVASSTPLWCIARNIAHFRVRLYFKGAPIDRRHICLTRIMYCLMGSFLCLATRICLAHWSRDKMAASLQTTHSNAFS